MLDLAFGLTADLAARLPDHHYRGARRARRRAARRAPATCCAAGELTAGFSRASKAPPAPSGAPTRGTISCCTWRRRRPARGRVPPLSGAGLPVPAAFRARLGPCGVYKSDTLVRDARRPRRAGRAILDVEIGLHVDYLPRLGPRPRRRWRRARGDGDHRLYALRARSRPRRRPSRPAKSRWRPASSAMPRSRASAWRPGDPEPRQPVPRMARDVCRRRIPEPGARGGAGARRAVREARRRGPLSRRWPPPSPPPPGSKPMFWQMGLAARPEIARPRYSRRHGSAPTRPDHRIVVAMSGGVDSLGRPRRCWSRAGFDVVGVTLAALRPRRRGRGGRARAAPGRMCATPPRSPSGSASRITCSITSAVSRRGDRGFCRQLRAAARRRSRASAATSGSSSATCSAPRATSAPPRWRPGITPAGCADRTGRSCTAPAIARATRAISSIARPAPSSISCAFRSAACAKDETRATGARPRPAGRGQSPTARTSASCRSGSYARHRRAAAAGSRRARRHRRPRRATSSAATRASRISRSASARGSASPRPEPLYVLRLEPEARRVVVGPRAALWPRRASRSAELNWLGTAAGAGRRRPGRRQAALGPAAGRRDAAPVGRARRRRRARARRARRRRRAGPGGGAVRRRPGARRRLDPPPRPPART